MVFILPFIGFVRILPGLLSFPYPGLLATDQSLPSPPPTRPLSSLPALFLKLNRSCDLLSASRYLNVNTGLVYSRFPVSVSLRVLSSPFHLPFLLCLLRSFNDPKSIPTPQLLLLLTLQHRPNGECSPLARPFHADAFRSETGSVTCMSVT